jgi:hypothetical protein
MVNKIFSATFALALLLAQVAHALPQGPTPPSLPTLSLPTPSPLRATFDPKLDNRDRSMDTVACSNLEGFKTFGDIPHFPAIGGAFDIVWYSPNCGSCWNITHARTGTSIQMTAIDGSGVGLGLGTVPFNFLTSGDDTPGDKTLHAVDVIANKLYNTPCTGR